jgi:hypothetical protein
MKSIGVTLPSSTASRIGQLVRLLGSDRSGEIVAAAAAIKRTLAGAGTDIHHLGDVVDRGLQHHVPPAAPQHRAPVDDDDIAAIIRFCAFPGNRLNERERDFIQSLGRSVLQIGDNFEPSEKQLAWLMGIYQRLRRQP